jgi:hypothetical protein
VAGVGVCGARGGGPGQAFVGDEEWPKVVVCVEEQLGLAGATPVSLIGAQ